MVPNLRAKQLVLVLESAVAADRPYLEGRFDLDMSQSSWDGGAKPMTGSPSGPFPCVPFPRSQSA